MTTKEFKLELKEGSIANEYISWNGHDYSICDLIEYSKNIQTRIACISSLCLNYKIIDPTWTLVQEAEGIKRALNVDTKYPILVAPDGFLLDGRHRLIKTILDGETKVKYKRLQDMPGYYRKTKQNNG